MGTKLSCLAKGQMRIGLYGWVAFAFLVLGSVAHSAPVQSATYNAGLAEAFGFSLVPYVNERIDPQIRELDQVLRPPFTLLLQEVWTKRAKKAYRKWAREKGYFYTDVSPKRNDLMIISSGPIVHERFIQFDQNTLGRRFGVLEAFTRLEITDSNGLPVETLVRVLNTHLVYSDKDAPNPVHLAQLAQFAELTHGGSTMPTIAGGDFNGSPFLEFSDGKYDPAQLIWHEGFASKLNPAWIHVGEGKEGPTWDQEKNNLVIEPAPLLKTLGFLDEKGGWGYPSSTLDHIFLSPHFRVINTEILLDKPMELKTGRKHKRIISLLSDHYAYACEAILADKK